MSIKSFIASLFGEKEDKSADVKKEIEKRKGQIFSNKTIINPDIDNAIVKLNGASIIYPSSVQSSNVYVETKLGVFFAPVFVRDSSGVDVCGVFTSKQSNKSHSFFFKVEDCTILIRNFNRGGYVYPLLYVFNEDEEEKKYERLNLKARSEIPVKAIHKPIFILRAESGFYYIDGRSDYRVFKYSDGDYYANTMDLNDDGSKLFIRYGRSTVGGGTSIGGTSAVASSEFRSFDISDGIPKLITHEKFDSGTQINVQPHLPKRVHYYFALNNKTAPQVAFKYVKEHLEYRILPNEFQDDESVNIDVTIDISDKKSVDFFRFINQKGITNYTIYGISVIGILNVGMETFEFNRYLVDKTPPDLKGACEDIINKISQKYDYNKSEVGCYLWDNYCPFELVNSIFLYSDPSESYEESRAIYNDMKSDMVASGELNTKWKSETELYRLVRKLFDHAVYQYRDDDVLGLQSLDVYIPDRKIAFEYQGIQHYEPVALFGGEEGLEKRKELDEEKRIKCLNNGIELIEWKYDEPVSQVVLKRKLRERGITIAF